MTPDPSRIFAISSAYFDSCVLFAASDLGVFAKLAELGAAGADELAGALAVDGRSLRLLLNAGAALGLLEKESGLYRNAADAAAFLVPGKPGTLTGALHYNRDVYPAWGKLAELVRRGAPVESPQLHLGDDGSRTRSFVLSMHGRALGMAPALLPLLDMAGKRRLLDVGGGPGTFSVLLAKRHPELRCTVIDLPPIVAIARQLIEEQHATGQVTAVAGSYHEVEFPAGNDAVLMFGMLHQEKEAGIRSLLAKAFDALAPGGRLHVLDMMTDQSHIQPKFSAMFGLNMALTKEEGWVFSDRDLESWVRDAGFSGFQVQALPAPIPHWLATAGI